MGFQALNDLMVFPPVAQQLEVEPFVSYLWGHITAQYPTTARPARSVSARSTSPRLQLQWVAAERDALKKVAETKESP